MPDIAGTRLPSPQVVGDERSELDHPAPDRFMRNVYATFQHHLLDLTQAQVEPDVEPDNMGDDLGRKPVALVADFLCLHRHRLRPAQSPRNLRSVNVTTTFTAIRAMLPEQRLKQLDEALPTIEDPHA